MTVFEDGTKENLHGHNYTTELTIEATQLVPFSVYKEALSKVTDAWDEKVLLASGNKHFKILGEGKGGLSFSLCKKNYLIPADEVVLLEVDNVTSESISQIGLETFLAALPVKVKKLLRRVSLRIEETPGQGASTTWSAK